MRQDALAKGRGAARRSPDEGLGRPPPAASVAVPELGRTKSQQLEQLGTTRERVGDWRRAVQRKRGEQVTVHLCHQEGSTRYLRTVEIGEELQATGVAGRGTAEGDPSQRRKTEIRDAAARGRLPEVPSVLARREEAELGADHVFSLAVEPVIRSTEQATRL